MVVCHFCCLYVLDESDDCLESYLRAVDKVNNCCIPKDCGLCTIMVSYICFSRDILFRGKLSHLEHFPVIRTFIK